MLLVEITFDSIIHRVSDEELALESYWADKVGSLDSVKYSIKAAGGGYVKPTFGGIDFLPSLFTGRTEYPVSCPIRILHTNDTEANAVVILEGTAHLTNIERDSVKYTIYATEYDTKVTDAAYSGTLESIFTTACTTLGLTLDATFGRVVSPAVSYTASGEKVLVDNLSDMAKFFSHLFYIESGILYLIDMKRDTQTVNLTEFDIYPSGYTYNPPVSIFKTGADTSEASVDGSYSYGDEDDISPQCHTDIVNSETALTDRKVILESPKILMKFPLDSVYKPGVKLILIDESQEITLNVEAKVRSVIWNFDSYECVVEGEGVFV